MTQFNIKHIKELLWDGIPITMNDGTKLIRSAQRRKVDLVPKHADI